MRTLFFVAIVFTMLAGCSQKKEEASRYQAQLKWDFATKAEFSKLEGQVQSLQSTVNSMVSPRSIPAKETRSTSFTGVSWNRQDDVKLEQPDAVQSGVAEIVKDEIAKQMQSVQVSSPPVQELNIQPTYSTGAIEYAVQSQPTFSSAPVKTYSTGQTYAGPAVQSGYKTTYQTKRVAKTVYEDVQVPVQTPVMKQPVYQTQVEEYEVPVQSTRTVMETQQRTRKVAKTIYVDEPYSVQVPRQVTETKMVKQTRTKRVKIGEREVAAPSYSAAPSYAAAPVQVCEPAPSYSAVVQAAPTFAQPIMQAAAPVCEPIYSAVAAPVAQAVQTYSAPVYSAPTYSTVEYSTPVQEVVYSSSRPRLFSSQGSTPRNPIRPFKAIRNVVSAPVKAVNNYSAVRTQAAKNAAYSGGQGFYCAD